MSEELLAFLDEREKARYRFVQLEESKLRARAWKRRYHALKKVHVPTVRNLRIARMQLHLLLNPKELEEQICSAWALLE